MENKRLSAVYFISLLVEPRHQSLALLPLSALWDEGPFLMKRTRLFLLLGCEPVCLRFSLNRVKESAFPT